MLHAMAYPELSPLQQYLSFPISMMAQFPESVLFGVSFPVNLQREMGFSSNQKFLSH